MSEDPPEEKPESVSTKNIVDMMLGAGRSGTLDTESLIKETQKRVWSSLKKGYEYDYSIDESDKFLRSHVDMKLPMIVIIVDLVGSTEMTLTLPTEKLAIIISSFSQEMRYVVRHHEGYVLKYVGDAVIGYFVAEDSPLLIADNAINCAKTMIDVIERGINPILTEYDYPELRVKIGREATHGRTRVFGIEPAHDQLEWEQRVGDGQVMQRRVGVPPELPALRYHA